MNSDVQLPILVSDKPYVVQKEMTHRNDTTADNQHDL